MFAQYRFISLFRHWWIIILYYHGINITYRITIYLYNSNSVSVDSNSNAYVYIYIWTTAAYVWKMSVRMGQIQVCAPDVKRFVCEYVHVHWMENLQFEASNTKLWKKRPYKSDTSKCLLTPLEPIISANMVVLETCSIEKGSMFARCTADQMYVWTVWFFSAQNEFSVIYVFFVSLQIFRYCSIGMCIYHTTIARYGFQTVHEQFAQKRVDEYPTIGWYSHCQIYCIWIY